MNPTTRSTDVTSELPFLSATEALAAFRARTLSPVELLDAVYAQADVVNPVVNAFSDERRDEIGRAHV